MGDEYILALFLTLISFLTPSAQGPLNNNLLAVPKVRRLERDRGPEFEFITVNSKVEESYAHLPSPSEFSWDRDGPFGGSCQVRLTLDLIDFEQVSMDPSVTLCLFQGDLTTMDNVFKPNTKIEILGNEFDPTFYYGKRQPITGFVIGEFHSVVHGFLVKENFFGTIRLFDPLPHHHIVFYVEPLRNLVFYQPALKNMKKEGGRSAALFEFVRHEDESAQVVDQPSIANEINANMESGLEHISERVKIQNGTNRHNVFDMHKNDSTICELCIWIQPHFAEAFGLRGGVPVGVAMVMRLFAFIQFILQGIDFNQDNWPDDITILLKEFLVTDSIGLDMSKLAPNPGTPVANATAKEPPPGGDAEEEEEETFTKEPITMTPKAAYEILRPQLAKKFAGKNCCGVIGYIFHNLAPKLSYATLGGICSRSHNVGIVSGYLHSHKVGEFDLYRATMHVMGHLFGAEEDDMANPKCKVDVVATPHIFNPNLMDSHEKIDVGIRPNSMRFSPCAKLEITAFLTTRNAGCLYGRPRSGPRCGNGIVEGGEECDGGLPWQCHSDEMERPSCCGESDTFVGCRKIGSQRFQSDAHCHRPFMW